MAFLVRYGAVFQMVDPAHELAYEASGTSFGLRSASFTQTEGAASVCGTRLTVVFDAGGHIAFVSGLYVPGLHGLSTTAKLCASQDGFTLHAATRAGAMDTVGREALCKYVLRPPIARAGHARARRPRTDHAQETVCRRQARSVASRHPGLHHLDHERAVHDDDTQR